MGETTDYLITHALVRRAPNARLHGLSYFKARRAFEAKGRRCPGGRSRYGGHPPALAPALALAPVSVGLLRQMLAQCFILNGQ